jgi:formate/nitrite transporter
MRLARSTAPRKIFGLGVLSGAQIGLGAALMLAVGGASPMLAANNPGLHKFILGAIGLPSGLFMTLMTGAELFTGNTALVTMAVMEDKADTSQLMKSWIMSYMGNFIGAVFLASLICTAGVIPGGGASVGAAAMKTSNSFGTNFVRGILCNWLVCTAVYLASFSRDVVGKMVALTIPVSAFVTLGLEHSVANMFIIPLAIFSGAAVTWKAFLFQNLLPVTLGNIVGGAVGMGAMMCWAYGKLGAD